MTKNKTFCKKLKLAQEDPINEVKENRFKNPIKQIRLLSIQKLVKTMHGCKGSHRLHTKT